MAKKKVVATSTGGGAAASVVAKTAAKVPALTVEQLESKVAEGGSGLKSLSELSQRAEIDWGNENEKQAARHALRRSFALLLERGELKVSSSASEAEQSVSLWLFNQFEGFLDQLVDWTWNDKSTQSERVAALRTIFWFAARERFLEEDDTVELEGDSVEITFGRRSLAKLIEVGCSKPSLQSSQDLVLRTIRDEYMNLYIDFRLYYLRAIRKVFLTTKKSQGDGEEEEEDASDNNSKRKFFAGSAFQMINLVPLPHLKTLEEDVSLILEYGDEPRGKIMREKIALKLSKIGMLKKAFQNAWLSFLRLKTLKASTYRSILNRLPALIPHFVQPLLLSDFLTDSFSINIDSTNESDEDELPLLALSSLFMLVRDYGLDYPNLYTRLYDLVRPSLFHSSNRESFCQLLDACLKSSHLPAYLIASYCKKLARVALLSTPSASLFALAMIYNLLRRHPNCVFLIHRMDNKKKNMLEQDEALEEAKRLKEIKEASRRLAMGLKADSKSNQVEDPFIYSEKDPAKSRATESSLWEIQTLQQHYCPSVASFARSVFAHDLAKDRLTKPELPIEDFVVTYQDLYAQEARLKKQPDQEGNKRIKVDAPLRMKKPADDCIAKFMLFGS